MAIYVPATGTGGVYQSGAGSGVAALNITTSFTITAWLRLLGSSTGNFPVFAQGDVAGNVRCVSLQIASGGGFRLITGGTGGLDVNAQSGNIFDEPVLGAGEDHWVYFGLSAGASGVGLRAVAILPGGQVRVHKQAFTGSTLPPSAPLNQSTNVLSDTVTHSSGSISDLRVWHEALTVTEMLKVADGGLLGNEKYRGYCHRSIGADLSPSGNHIPDATMTNRFLVNDPAHLQGGRIILGNRVRRRVKSNATVAASATIPVFNNIYRQQRG